MATMMAINSAYSATHLRLQVGMQSGNDLETLRHGCIRCLGARQQINAISFGRPLLAAKTASSLNLRKSDLTGGSLGIAPAALGLKPNLQKSRSFIVRAGAGDQRQFGAGAGYAPQYGSEEDPDEGNRRAAVSKRLDSTARYFRRLGTLGFWAQLICSCVAAVILAFSIVVTGQATAPVTTYLTCAGIAAGFLATFWSYGYMRLANRLRSVVNNPSKAPPRATVVDNLKNGLIINLLGAGSSVLGLEATVGVLVAKALTSSYQPFGPGAPAGYSPVLALDVFLVQACANTLLSHLIGLVLSLELLRSLTLQQPPPDSALPKAA